LEKSVALPGSGVFPTGVRVAAVDKSKYGHRFVWLTKSLIESVNDPEAGGTAIAIEIVLLVESIV
jgi:hypothetical protein